jgi:sensor domain CHASE-containing protein
LGVLPVLLGLVLVVNLALMLWLVLYQRSASSQASVIKRLADQSSGLQEALTRQFAAATGATTRAKC